MSYCVDSSLDNRIKEVLLCCFTVSTNKSLKITQLGKVINDAKPLDPVYDVDIFLISWFYREILI